MTDQPPRQPPQSLRGLTRAFAVLGKRWNGLVIAALATSPAGFVQVRRRVSGISDRDGAQVNLPRPAH